MFSSDNGDYNILKVKLCLFSIDKNNWWLRMIYIAKILSNF